MTTPFQHVTQFPKRTKEEIGRLESMNEEERRADYFKRKKRNKLRIAFLRSLPYMFIAFCVFVYIAFIMFIISSN